MLPKSPEKIPSILICLTCWLCVIGPGFAQMGVSSMSVGMTKAGLFPAPGEIEVAHFINYHQHRIPIPNSDQRLALDLKQLTFDENYYLQIGLATPRHLEFEEDLPLNLVMVIDVSGSMAGGNRMARVKHGLLNLVERLRPDDRVAIITFSTTAQLLLPGCQKTDQARIQAAIAKLRPTGSTNLHHGLMLGYNTALESFDNHRSNRVILLTDGIANVGEVNPARIAEESARFNQQGIDLSTIGVGQDFNQQLLKELAIAGKGAVHFVDDQDDLTKVFVEEVDSLLNPSARNIKLQVSGFDPHFPPKVFGYSPHFEQNRLDLHLENMNCKSTQVVILEFPQQPRLEKLKVRIKFDDAITGERKLLKDSININFTPVTISNDWQDQQIGLTKNRAKKREGDDRPVSLGDFPKNLAIALVAQSLDQATHVVAGRSAESAKQDLIESDSRRDECRDECRDELKHGRSIIKRAIKRARQIFDDPQDTDFNRVLKIAQNFLDSQ